MDPKAARQSRGGKGSRVQGLEVSRVRTQMFAVAVPVLAAIAVYLPALRNGFIWDDPLVLQQLRAIHSLGDLLVPPAIIPKFYFRPLIFVTYLFDRALGGETPVWFHASVIGFHALNTWLVFLLGRRLFPAQWLIASGGALLFAVFPTHVESVAWMAGRSDVIVCTFVLLTALLGMDRTRAWSCWLGGLTFLLAALSKEMALACVLLVPLLDLLSTRRLYLMRYAPLVLGTIVYFLLRHHALGAFVGGTATAATVPALVLDLVHALGFYVVRAIAPVQLCAYIPAIPGDVVYLVAGAAAPLLAAAGAALAWRRGRWEVAYLFAWFFATLAPSLTVIVRRSASAVLADRYLYVPTVASCLLLARALVALAERQRLAVRTAAVAIGVLSLVFAARAVPYTRVWTDNVTFWTDAVAKVPDSALPHRELGSALLERGQLPGAERAFQRALETTSDAEGRAMTYGNLGNVYRRQRRYTEAQAAFEAALDIGPHPALYHNLGMTLMAKIEDEQHQGDQAGVVRDIVKARDAFEHALQLKDAPAAQTFLQQWDPAKTHSLLGQVLFSMGDRAAARQHLEAALRLEPSGPVADLTRQYLKSIGQ